MGEQHTEAKRVRVFKTPGWLIVCAPYNADFAEDIRRISYVERRFCDSIGAWAVRFRHKDEVISCLQKRFNLRRIAIH